MTAQRSEFEQKLHDEQLACRRCVAALERVDLAARRRILNWLINLYGPTQASGDTAVPGPGRREPS
jgi:hypothetical protein